MRFLLFLLRIYHVDITYGVVTTVRSPETSEVAVVRVHIPHTKLPNVSCNNSQRCHRACINNVDREHYNHQRAHSTPPEPIHIAQADKSFFISYSSAELIVLKLKSQRCTEGACEFRSPVCRIIMRTYGVTIIGYIRRGLVGKKRITDRIESS